MSETTLTFECQSCGLKDDAKVAQDELEQSKRPAKTINYCHECDKQTTWEEAEWVTINVK